MKKCLLSAAMLMAGMGAWAQDAATVTQEEKYNAYYEAFTYTYMLGQKNLLGYPLNSSSGFTALSDILPSITDPNNITDEQYLYLSYALKLFYEEDDVLMPEEGKAYTIKAICDPEQSFIGWGDKSYLPKGSTEGVGAEFVCKKTDDGKYLFASDNGYYLSWEGTSGTTNTTNEYDVDAEQLFTLEKANFEVGNSNIDGIDISDLLGMFCLKANNGHYLMYNVKTPAPYSAEVGSKYYTTEGVTTFFTLAEVTDYTTNQFTIKNTSTLADTDLCVATFYSPNYATKMPDGYTAYWAESVDNREVSLKALSGDIPANTAVVVTCPVPDTESATVTVSLSTTNPDKTQYEDNKLFGYTTDTNTSEAEATNVYTLAKGTNGVAFYRYGATQFAAGKAYLDAGDVAAGARSLIFNFGGDTETAIESIQGAESADAVVYDLAGRRVQGAQKGLYIVNGKVVIK